MAYNGPFVNPAFRRQVATQVDAPLIATVSGEITANKTIIVGSPRFTGKLDTPFFSVLHAGKDDSNDLQLELDIQINGTTCFTTKPVIAHVSGEADAQKTTVVSGDTGVTVGVLDGDAVAVSPGDIITGILTLTRTASPTTEMADVAVVVPLLPD